VKSNTLYATASFDPPVKTADSAMSAMQTDGMNVFRIMEFPFVEGLFLHPDKAARNPGAGPKPEVIGKPQSVTRFCRYLHGNEKNFTPMFTRQSTFRGLKHG
jgi:hypothetical protein